MATPPTSRLAAVINILYTSLGSEIMGVSPVPLPDSINFPYITVQEGMTGGLESHDGDSGISIAFIQVNVWDKDYEMANYIRNKARDLLTNYSGTVLGLVIQGSNHQVDAYLYDGPRQLHQCISRLSIWFED